MLKMLYTIQHSHISNIRAIEIIPYLSHSLNDLLYNIEYPCKYYVYKFNNHVNNIAYIIIEKKELLDVLNDPT